MDKVHFLTDFYKFCQSIGLKIFYYDEKKMLTQNDNAVAMRLKKKSKFDPMGENTMLDAFQNIVISEVTEKWEPKKMKNQRNLSPTQRKELNALKKS